MNIPVSGNDIEQIIVKTEYFQKCLEQLLNVLQPSFFCLDLVVKVLVHGPEGGGKRLLAKEAAKRLSMLFLEERVADLFDENIIGTEKKIRASFMKLTQNAPCLFYLTGYELFCKLEDVDLDRVEHCIRETLEKVANEKTQPIVVICATSNFELVFHSPLSDIFQHNIPLKSPTLNQAQELLNSMKADAELSSNPVTLLSTFTNGEYYLGNLIDIASEAEVRMYEASKLENTNPIDLHNVEHEVDTKSGTRWMDIGGLNEVKKEIIDVIQLSIDFPQLKKSGLRHTGILLYGPPGTGKTLLARAVATECSLNFIGIKGPELLNEYVGQSEDNIRRLFQKARESSPAVIFFDELDSLAPNRGNAGDSGGVMDRMVSQILAEMDGVGKSDSVFVIGATNRKDLVDPSLLRPGRFDKVLEVPLPKSRESRLQILSVLTKKLNLAQDVDLDKLESLAPAGFSGADFQGWCSKALQTTLDRCVHQVESDLVKEECVEFITCMEDFTISLMK